MRRTIPGDPYPIQRCGGGVLVLQSDRDDRGFFIGKDDVGTTLAGGTGAVRLLGTLVTVGTARLSISGRALNMVIDGKLRTAPLRLLMLVVEGGHGTLFRCRFGTGGEEGCDLKCPIFIASS